MARQRRPERDKAREIWVSSKGSLLLKDIAAKLGVSEEQIRKWKSQDKWEQGKVTLPKPKSNVTKERDNDKAAVESVMSNKDLNDKQRLFCLYYSRSFNATRSYQKVYGCSYETAMTSGPALLGNPRVRDEITRLKELRYSQALLTPEDIFQKYMDIAFADITDYVDWGREEVPVMGPFGPITVKDAATGEKTELTKMVNSVRFRESCGVDGSIVSEIKQGKDGASIKLVDRMKALDWLADHMNMATPEQAARVAKMTAETNRILGEGIETEDISETDAEIYGE